MTSRRTKIVLSERNEKMITKEIIREEVLKELEEEYRIL